jgi:hypothetical protein
LGQQQSRPDHVGEVSTHKGECANMSWSVAATGRTKDVAPEIVNQISKINLTDQGEMETVKNAGLLIAQTLGTFDPEKPVKVTASGSMGFADWTNKSGPYQHVTLTIEPIHFSVSS